MAMESFNDIFTSLLLAAAAGLSAILFLRGLYVSFRRSSASFSKHIGDRLLFKSALVFLFSAIAFTGAYMTHAEKRKSGNGEWGTGNGEWGTAYWGNGRPARLEREAGNGIQISSFSSSTNSVEIETLINPDSILPGSRILAYAKFGDLIASAWTNVASSIVLPGETNLSFNISLPEPPPSSSFFVLARENDSDGEGLDDSFERYVALTDPFSADTDGDGWDDFSEIAAGTCATNSSLSLSTNINGYPVLKISDALSFSTNAISDLASPQGSGFYSLQVATPRPTAWKQVFVSGSPDGSAGWNLSGAQISYEDSDGMCGTIPSVSTGGYRLQLSTNANLSVTITIGATAAQVSLDSPLYLHFYEPQIIVADSHDYTDTETDVGYHVVVGEWQDGYAPSARLSVDRSARPATAPLSDEETNASPLPENAHSTIDPDSGDSLVFEPGKYTLADGSMLLFLKPSVTYGGGHAYVGDALVPVAYEQDAGGYYPAAFKRKSAYPLDSKCLYESWHTGTNETGYSVCSCEPELELGTDIGDFDFLSVELETTGGMSDEAKAKLYLDGALIWADTAVHSSYGGDTFQTTSNRLSESGGCDDSCGGCADGSCDAIDGPSAGSVRFRMSLGIPMSRRIPGFLYFDRENVFTPTVDSLILLKRPDAMTSDTTTNGVRTVVSNAEGGFTAIVSPIEDGISIVSLFTDSLVTNRSWRITLENGAMRFRKFSAGGNLMEDRLFAGNAAGEWTETDATTGLSTLRREWGVIDFNDGKWVETIVMDSCKTVSHVRVCTKAVGWGRNAVPREVERMEMTSCGEWLHSYAAYWECFGAESKNGALKAEWGDDRSWSSHDYDDSGRETFRLEQRNGSILENPDSYYDIENLPENTDAFLTIFDYTPHPGDANSTNDFRKARTMTRYVVSGGPTSVSVVTPISRTWTTYTRGTAASGWPVVTETVERASSPSASRGDTGNALSARTCFSSDSAAIPLILRGETVSETDENGITETYAYSILSNATVRTVVSRTKNGHEAKTRRVTERDLVSGNVLYEATRLSSDPSVEFDWKVFTYDNRNRLRNTLYSDGSYETNEYSCCRLLSRTGRTGAKTLYCATPALERLYHAEEEIYLSQLPRGGDYCYEGGSTTAFQNAFRVTQHYMDAFGRETNTVIRSGTEQGASSNMDSTATRWYKTSSTTSFPSGFSDWSESIDKRGLATASRTTETQEASISVLSEFPPGAMEPDSTTTNIMIRGGGSECSRTANGHFTIERHFTVYDPNGLRNDIRLTESDDCGIVTNSVVSYDFLGRSVCVKTPLSCVSNVYDGTSSRIIYSIDLLSGLAATNLYDAIGNPIGAISRSVRHETLTDYVCESNQWWLTESEVVSSGAETNQVSLTKTQLTGLSDSLRSRRISLLNGVETVRAETSFNPETADETEIIYSATEGTSTRKLRFGRVLEKSGPEGTLWNYYDFFGWKFYIKRSRHYDGYPIKHRLVYYNDFGDVTGDEYRYAAGTSWENQWKGRFYGYDFRGNLIETEDELGNVVTNAFDSNGKMLSAGGDTYPLRFAYDSAGRRTSLMTTRSGSEWDETAWTYDAATGLRAAKTYADGSIATNTWTSDGLPLRTVSPGGGWVENTYDGLRRNNGAYSSDPTCAFGLELDTFGRTIAASNSVARYGYALHRTGIATNETAFVDGTSCSIARQVDQYGRLTALSGGGATDVIGYSEDNGRISSISNSGVCVTYKYTGDLLDAGYDITLANGNVFSREMVRTSSYRRGNVDSVVNVSPTGTNSFAYVYDLADRPVSRTGGMGVSPVQDSFAYNPRGEVSSATIGGNHETHEYDSIGNSIIASFNGTTSTYSANNLNQYSSISTSDFGHQTSDTYPQYDLDGNMTRHGGWTYAYDAANRLKTVSTNGVAILTNCYDHLGRRVRKITPDSTRTFFYDGWMPIKEIVAYANGTSTTIRYHWGKDLSGTLHGAGGVGGLLYLAISNSSTPNSSTPQLYIPWYDNNGNIMGYWDEQGNAVASYTYDAFGNIIGQSGTMADAFSFRLSTKYFDSETGLYYYGYRYYSPILMRWLTRDPIEEAGGVNLYTFNLNSPVSLIDTLGQKSYSQCKRNGIPIELVFDGRTLSGAGLSIPAASGKSIIINKTSWVSNEKILGSPACGGTKFEYTFDYSAERQKIKKEGPIPEGEYWIEVNEKRNSRTSMYSHIILRAGWGDFSWSLHPEETTQTYGRGGFFIHGGYNWGSAGCIDIKEGDVKLNGFLSGLCDCYVPVKVAYVVKQNKLSEREITWHYTIAPYGVPYVR